VTCPHCGTEVIPGNAFCQRCRKRVLAPGAVPAGPTGAADSASYAPGFAAPSPAAYGDSFPRPGTVTFLAVLDILAGAFALLAMLGGFVFLLQPSKENVIIAVVMITLYGGIGVWYLIAGIGLLKMKPYGRIAHIALSILGLLAIPIGTVLSALMLVYFFKPGVKIMFSGRSPHGLAPEEARQVEEARQSSALLIAAIAIVVFLFVVMFIGIIAAIAIPSLLRARVSANEAASIGDLRAVISAEVAYASVNSQQYDTIECLITPSSCVPGYAATSPAFLDARFAQAVRHGYAFELHPGPAPSPADFDAARASPTSVVSFAYVAVPTQVNRTGRRSFCGDATGRVCEHRDGSPFQIENGLCPADCQNLF
jgi:type IV pilus assembly protein PilA